MRTKKKHSRNKEVKKTDSPSNKRRKTSKNHRFVAGVGPLEATGQNVVSGIKTAINTVANPISSLKKGVNYLKNKGKFALTYLVNTSDLDRMIYKNSNFIHLVPTEKLNDIYYENKEKKVSEVVSAVTKTKEAIQNLGTKVSETVNAAATNVKNTLEKINPINENTIAAASLVKEATQAAVKGVVKAVKETGSDAISSAWETINTKGVKRADKFKKGDGRFEKMFAAVGRKADNAQFDLDFDQRPGLTKPEMKKQTWIEAAYDKSNVLNDVLRETLTAKTGYVNANVADVIGDYFREVEEDLALIRNASSESKKRKRKRGQGQNKEKKIMAIENEIAKEQKFEISKGLLEIAHDLIPFDSESEPNSKHVLIFLNDVHFEDKNFLENPGSQSKFHIRNNIEYSKGEEGEEGEGEEEEDEESGEGEEEVQAGGSNRRNNTGSVSNRRNNTGSVSNRRNNTSYHLSKSKGKRKGKGSKKRANKKKKKQKGGTIKNENGVIDDITTLFSTDGEEGINSCTIANGMEDKANLIMEDMLEGAKNAFSLLFFDMGIWQSDEEKNMESIETIITENGIIIGDPEFDFGEWILSATFQLKGFDDMYGIFVKQPDDFERINGLDLVEPKPKDKDDGEDNDEDGHEGNNNDRINVYDIKDEEKKKDDNTLQIEDGSQNQKAPELENSTTTISTPQLLSDRILETALTILKESLSKSKSKEKNNTKLLTLTDGKTKETQEKVSQLLIENGKPELDKRKKKLDLRQLNLQNDFNSFIDSNQSTSRDSGKSLDYYKNQFLEFLQEENKIDNSFISNNTTPRENESDRSALFEKFLNDYDGLENKFFKLAEEYENYKKEVEKNGLNSARTTVSSNGSMSETKSTSTSSGISDLTDSTYMTEPQYFDITENHISVGGEKVIGLESIHIPHSVIASIMTTDSEKKDDKSVTNISDKGKSIISKIITPAVSSDKIEKNIKLLESLNFDPCITFKKPKPKLDDKTTLVKCYFEHITKLDDLMKLGKITKPKDSGSSSVSTNTTDSSLLERFNKISIEVFDEFLSASVEDKGSKTERSQDSNSGKTSKEKETKMYDRDNIYQTYQYWRYKLRQYLNNISSPTPKPVSVSDNRPISASDKSETDKSEISDITMSEFGDNNNTLITEEYFIEYMKYKKRIDELESLFKELNKKKNGLNDKLTKLKTENEKTFETIQTLFKTEKKNLQPSSSSTPINDNITIMSRSSTDTNTEKEKIEKAKKKVQDLYENPGTSTKDFKGAVKTIIEDKKINDIDFKPYNILSIPVKPKTGSGSTVITEENIEKHNKKKNVSEQESASDSDYKSAISGTAIEIYKDYLGFENNMTEVTEQILDKLERIRDPKKANGIEIDSQSGVESDNNSNGSNIIAPNSVSSTINKGQSNVSSAAPSINSVNSLASSPKNKKKVILPN